jgi:hypothetical protein
MNKEALIAAGKVVSIWRYPVKSMLGEELNSSYITERGLSYTNVDKACFPIFKIISNMPLYFWFNLFYILSPLVSSS